MVSSHPGPGLETVALPFLNRSKSTYQISPLVKKQNRTRIPSVRNPGTGAREENTIAWEIPVDLNTSFPEMRSRIIHLVIS